MEMQTESNNKEQIYNDNLAKVRNNGLALKDIPEEQQNDKIRLVAIKQNGYALNFILPITKRFEFMFESAKQTKMLVRYVNGEFQFHDNKTQIYNFQN